MSGAVSDGSTDDSNHSSTWPNSASTAASTAPAVDGRADRRMLGSTVVGIALVRCGYRPRLTAWLLALSFPLWIIGGFGLGHNGLGLLPIFIAWAAAGWRWRAVPNGQRAADSPSDVRLPRPV